MGKNKKTEIEKLNDVVQKLRAPGGCPWDRAQTTQSLAPYLLEETYEALDAIDSSSNDHLCEELGDILIQILMHCAIAQDLPSGFTIEDIAQRAKKKMIYRHPHVFGDVKVSGVSDVVANWEKLKAAEKKHRTSIFDGIPPTLPSLPLAYETQEKMAGVGFPLWKDAAQLLAEIRDELFVVENLMMTKNGQTVHRTDEFGNEGGETMRDIRETLASIFFMLVSLSRYAGENPEDLVRCHVKAIQGRCAAIETEANKAGRSVGMISPEEWKHLWETTNAVETK